MTATMYLEMLNIEWGQIDPKDNRGGLINPSENSNDPFFIIIYQMIPIVKPKTPHRADGKCRVR